MGALTGLEARFHLHPRDHRQPSLDLRVMHSLLGKTKVPWRDGIRRMSKRTIPRSSRAELARGPLGARGFIAVRLIPQLRPSTFESWAVQTRRHCNPSVPAAGSRYVGRRSVASTCQYSFGRVARTPIFGLAGYTRVRGRRHSLLKIPSDRQES